MNFQCYCGKIQKMRSERSLPSSRTSKSWVVKPRKPRRCFSRTPNLFAIPFWMGMKKKHYIDVIISLLAACYVKAVPFSFSLSLLLSHTHSRAHTHTRVDTTKGNRLTAIKRLSQPWAGLKRAFSIYCCRSRSWRWKWFSWSTFFPIFSSIAKVEKKLEKNSNNLICGTKWPACILTTKHSDNNSSCGST